MKFLLKKYKIFFICYLPFFIFVMFICLYKTNYSSITTGDITNLNTIFEVEDGYSSEGSLNSVFVYSSDKISLFQKWTTKLDKNAYIYIPSSNYLKFSVEDTIKMGNIEKKQSIEASVIYAYKKASELNSDINLTYSFKGLIIHYYVQNSDMQFKIGDIISEINGVTADNGYENLYNAYINMMEGSSVTVIRSGNNLSFETNADSSNYIKDEKTYSNISVYEKYDINYSMSYPKLNISSINTQGPSAGLMQTLCIYNQLVSEDITNGKRIVGTGTIDVSGNVGVIGGIEQKVVAAYKNKATYFLCPESNYEDGYAQYQKLGKKKSRMKFIMVKTFEDALEAIYNA